MAQWVKEPGPKVNDLNSIPKIHRVERKEGKMFKGGWGLSEASLRQEIYQ